MDPATLALVFGLLEQAVKQTPAIIAEIQALFASGAPSAEQWAELRARVAGETYAEFVPASDLPPSTIG